MSLLHTVRDLTDLRKLNEPDAAALAEEIRHFLVCAVSRTGGHLGPNLGTVELTLAVHRAFRSPHDVVLWDTGHQAYVHKLMTGRRDFSRLRQQGGVSGYPSRAESPHDVVENSHASTALSWAYGIAQGLRLRNAHDRSVVAVVGDGALTGGMCWEALNNIATAPQLPLTIVLNDNGRSYDPTVGGLARHLADLRTRHDQRPEFLDRFRARLRMSERAAELRSVFEDFGIDYLGPVDGHDIGAVEAALRQAKIRRRPVIVHCTTRKGRGYSPAENDANDNFHGIGATKAVVGGENTGGAQTWTSVFGTEIIAQARAKPTPVALTAAMLRPVGLAGFAALYPDRIFDVGIAEQHAATTAAGMAFAGMHPVFAVYATFLNRAFDQVLMDVALHRAGVTFVLDRAGITGDDGPSHNGMWDLSILQVVPGLRIAAPRDATTLREEFREALAIDDAPTVVRFPKGKVGPSIPALERRDGLDILTRGRKDDVLVVSVGSMAATCLGVAEVLAESDFGVTVVDPRWIKPVNRAIVKWAERFRLVVTVEDGCRVGGVGSALAQALADNGVATPVRSFGIPAEFLDHAPRAALLEHSELTPDAIGSAVAKILETMVAALPG